mmetsp:Transcript_46866/g.116819  ORF Transcript_46866/g.116819 Transcript_46866/m.116819 type:complete len:202 (-) Transcript_46866:53-658(-)
MNHATPRQTDRQTGQWTDSRREGHKASSACSIDRQRERERERERDGRKLTTLTLHSFPRAIYVCSASPPAQSYSEQTNPHTQIHRRARRDETRNKLCSDKMTGIAHRQTDRQARREITGQKGRRLSTHSASQSVSQSRKKHRTFTHSLTHSLIHSVACTHTRMLVPAQPSSLEKALPSLFVHPTPHMYRTTFSQSGGGACG